MNIELFEGQVAHVFVTLEGEHEGFEVYGGTSDRQFVVTDSWKIEVPAVLTVGCNIPRYDVFVRNIATGHEWCILSGKITTKKRQSAGVEGSISPVEYHVTVPVELGARDKKTGDIVKLVKDYLVYNEDYTEVTGNFDNLVACNRMFYNNSALTSFEAELPALTEGSQMFYLCSALTSFKSELPALTGGSQMFYNNSALTSFEAELPALTNSNQMFYKCSALTSFKSELPALTSVSYMFGECSALTSFEAELPALTNGDRMFYKCSALTSFKSELPALTSGDYMIYLTQLDKPSALRVLNSIPSYTSGTHKLSIGIHIDHKTDTEVLAAIENAKAKRWTLTVQWNGTATSGISSMDLEEIWCKVEESEYGEYVNESGARCMLEWCHMVASPDGKSPAELGYTLFSSLEEAEQYFKLTKLEE